MTNRFAIDGIPINRHKDLDRGLYVVRPKFGTNNRRSNRESSDERASMRSIWKYQSSKLLDNITLKLTPQQHQDILALENVV